ncbi:hypothetical protein SGFS_086390 [Streptomyces graminofaciens]|uniref:Uncharacterized protein n=1 Tax=Streptomyces graminofaciens TaxID=68212 RepID=A0ABN5VVL0_9ACTN|nr:hypothetical protein [Streptomyces graminofaciens]BBC37345.1 hypothetical protein SGFS_086390 [Streptomyces graminofaciens]
MGGYEEDGQRFVSLAGLRVRGWTGGMVHRLLGAADRLSVNPRVRGGPRVRLYRLARVETAERSAEFRAMAEASGRRSEAVRAAVRRRREEVLERIWSEPIDVPRLDPGRLALRAVEHRARKEAEWRRAGVTGPARRDGTPPDRGAAPPTAGPVDRAAAPPTAGPVDRSSLDPWKVDYLRHRLSHYDQLLDGLPGYGRHSGRAEAVTLLRQRICAAIAEVYPALAQECEIQACVQGAGPPLQ